MDSYELLVATMKALGDSSMEKDYQTLIQMRQKIKESTAVSLKSTCFFNPVPHLFHCREKCGVPLMQAFVGVCCLKAKLISDTGF